ncbi:hypothetical protein [Tunicatimonas pelagia]|uniref:hypothetical protein n=1 Tax=Tunicatimonas pelagia TaxID=931531 RepID=UPI002666AFFC|nr:hypothetical protein [Tunicatimonas pelagia]WKN43781.1 hypothetical protein P0M28_02190 [Tunicatimonas pelagia]
MTQKLFLLSALLLVLIIPAIGQASDDVIYQLDDEPIACVITEVTEQVIRYKHPENQEGPDYILKKDKALLIFKENGDYLLPGEGDTDWVSGTSENNHKIITKTGQVVAAQFIEVEGADIKYQGDQGTNELSTEDVLLVIYKDGRHELYDSPEKVAQGLVQVSSQISEMASGESSNSMAEAFNPEEIVTASTSTIPAGDVINLSAEQKAHFERMAEVKANDFGKYLRIISNKKEDEEDKLYAIRAAVKLFINDSVKIEVSSVNRDEKRQFTVPEYLDRLRMLPYDKVELVWMRAQLVSQLRPGQDGKYYGVIAAQQLFRGYIDNKIQYQDVTEKNIEVVLARYEVFDEGVKKQKWDVFLSDIGVQQTREK